MADALRQRGVERHGEAWRAEEKRPEDAARPAGRRGARGAGREPGPHESPGAALSPAGAAREAAQWLRRRVLRAPPGTCAAAERAAPVTSTADSCRREGRKPDSGRGAWEATPKEPGHRGTGAPGNQAPAEAERKSREAGGPLCRLTETRLWGQELRVGFTWNGSLVPSTHISVKGQAGRGAQGTGPRCPRGGWE